ncbi:MULTISPECIES: succinate dehydrogenase, hydrophobic membrane anchor protein [Methylosinus]|uniref:Succinate dehydrogenase hydrophobic membrane anchor subunit n=1 Tax=Methylosinus trichosporium (strain ATCC 35070 / NCIMB 11131 / UNIQEM 75 / OB3b) TaxID=595536 RepID=A0A2D2CZX3_METT3|nr:MULTISPECIES: succinate dehydrogenase, hydrophobic membrane anchor protein [Methylosinus]ATQ68313.1 succinate dehydrogenase, hydrophobic membrane anchor protein [Methylosinus trichosporium OB3b]OBS50948.1 succinate dehydrogenase, hydrophobic membrane anchor protein [Methylosinus sp. 3S-1]
MFESGRSGKGAAFTSDRSGSLHALAMRHSARALAPLGLLSVWFIANLSGQSYEAARAHLGRPLPAITLIAFICIASYHARLGMETIVEDYVHDEALKARALQINKWLTVAIAASWTLSIMIIAAPR